ncbi:arylsulfatase [Luteolibacter sp. AS25]|uniref:arylsulfatase n=1 Tax=Luteolibacter sp. AS25 TaxID=3135776 RepID=UPI00398A5EBA
MNKNLQPGLLAFLITSVTAVALAAGTKPNIILIMPDDAGYGDYACLGNPLINTPAVDAFKKQSLLFTQFHVSPKCGPTRAALMSGAHEFRSGVTHTILERERMSLDITTMPQVLKTAGYTSGIFGKWHLGDEAEYRPESRGFDEVYIHGAGGIGQTYSGSCGDAPGNTNINPALFHNGKWVKTNGYCTDLFFGQAEKWIKEKVDEKKPFFAFIAPNAPHGPHVLPKEYYDQYVGKPGISPDLAKFYGMIENIDTNFATLLDTLERLGIAENTLVIYLGSDNGGTSGVKIYNAGMKGGKMSPYQGGTRVPCFVRWPDGGVPADVVSDKLTAHIDLFPTFAEIANAPVDGQLEGQLHGRSILPLLKNPDTEWSDRLLMQHVGSWADGESAAFKHRECRVQNSRFSLVKYDELYDIQADPGETKNIAAQHPEIVANLRESYDQWWEEMQPHLTNENVVGPEVNPMKVIYWEQFGGGPDKNLLKRMDPTNRGHKSIVDKARAREEKGDAVKQ